VEQIFLAMEKRRFQKYVVSGAKRYCFTTSGLKIRKRKNRGIQKDEDGRYQVSVGDQIYTGELVQKKQNRYTVEVNGNRYEFVIEQDNTLRRKAHLAEKGHDKAFSLKSPMPGKICEVFVAKGVSVKKGEPLLVLEAMKMQNQVLSSVDATVTAVHIRKGDSVFGEQILMEFERQ
jgi:biotin carboxyl carrier protein